MKKLLLILLCLPMIGFGQGWVQNFYFSNFSDWEVGSVEEINGSEYIFFVDNGFIKTDHNGDTLFTNLNYQGLHDGCQTIDGGYILLGGDSVYKLDEMGIEQWAKPHYEGEARAITQAADSGYVITGLGGADGLLQGGISKADEHIGVVKMNSIGDTLWTCQVYPHNINFDIEGIGDDIIQANNGDYIVAGLRYISNTSLPSNSHAVLVRINDLGDTLWTKQYLFGIGTWAHSVVEDSFGNITFTGFYSDSTSVNSYCQSLLLTQTDSQGNIIWVKTYDGYCETSGQSIAKTNDGGYVICGGKGLQNSEYKIWLLKTDSQGDTLWTRTFGNPYGYGVSARQTSDGGYIIGGYAYQNSFNSSVMLIKTDGQGNVTSTFNIPINPNKKLEKVVDILGRETKGKTNEPLFYIYDDGSVEKRITIE